MENVQRQKLKILNALDAYDDVLLVSQILYNNNRPQPNTHTHVKMSNIKHVKQQREY